MNQTPLHFQKETFLKNKNDNVTERYRQRRPRDSNPNNLQRQLQGIVISAATNEEDLLPFLRNLIAQECSKNNQETQDRHQNLNTSHSQATPSNDTLIKDETTMNKIIYQINKANSFGTMKIFTGKGARTKQRTDYRNLYFSLTQIVKTYTQLRAAIPIFPSLLTNPDSRNQTPVLIDEKIHHLAIEKISLHLQRSLPSNITTLESGSSLLNYMQGTYFPINEQTKAKSQAELQFMPMKERESATSFSNRFLTKMSDCQENNCDLHYSNRLVDLFLTGISITHLDYAPLRTMFQTQRS
jgi:hypothetical protein